MTEFIKEKIATLQSLIQQFELEKFQHELLVIDAESPVEHAKASQQMAELARDARMTVGVCQRRIDVRKAELAKLLAELDTGN